MNQKNRVAIAFVVVIAVFTGALTFGGAAATASQQPPPSGTAQDDGFVPVKDLGDQEQLPAAPLVIGAYAIAWIAVLLYLWSIWRRLSRVESEIASISRRIEAGTRPGAHP